MNPTRRAFTVVLALGLIILIGLLSLPVEVHADDDYTYDESTPDGSTSDDDQIYFGYCATCYRGGPGLRICRKTGDDVTETAVAQGTGTLIIRGGGGNDHIEAISNDDKLDYHFDDFYNLTYTVVRLYGGEGHDLIIGPPKAEEDRYQGLSIGLYGEDGNDHLVGNRGGDRLYGGPDNDYLEGWGGDDYLAGGGGEDFLFGDHGDDRLFGGEAHDILVGGTGQDEIDGGVDTDSFVCRTASSPHPIHDPFDYDTSCDDSPEPHRNIELDAQRDPYTEWAHMWWWGNGTTYYFQTTSNPRLLLDDRDLGAVILMGPDGEPLHTTHKQCGQTCGPTSLNMVMEHLGFADRTQRLYMPSHLGGSATPEYSALTGYVDVGYYLSVEHIMYEGYDRSRSLERDWQENEFLRVGGYLKRGPTGHTRGHYEIDYELEYDADDKVQWWLENGPAVGTDEGGEVEVRVNRGLPFVANKFSEGQPDANPVELSIGPGGNFASLNHLKEVIRGFIDHNIPLTIGIENGGHFNTLMGYWDVGPYFYVYTADPLDGWGHLFSKKPMRWRRMLLTPEALPGGTKYFVSMMLYGHAGSAWAHNIDARFDPDILTGYLSSMPDFYPFFIERRPLSRPLEVPEGTTTTLTFPEDPTYGGIHRARDPEGAPITYHWDWDGDRSYDETGSETSHTLTWRDGYLSRRVLVKACDGASSNSLCARATAIWIVVTNVPPSPEVVDVEGSVEPFCSDYKYTLLIDDHDPAGWWDRPYTIDIDWGDGHSSSYVNEFQADHFYAVSEHEQSRTIDISVTDKDGGQGSTSVTVTVPRQSLTVRNPSSGVVCLLGRPCLIQWDSNAIGRSVTISYSIDGGANWYFVNPYLHSTENDGEYEWYPSHRHLSENVQIRIISNACPMVSVISEPFAIRGQGISVTSPSRGDIWFIGEPAEVTWTSHNIGDLVVITLYGRHYPQGRVLANTYNDGSYIWTVSSPASNDWRIQVTSYASPDIDDLSPQFSIHERGLKIIVPHIATTYYIGEDATISWEGFGGGDYVMLELSRDDGLTWSTIEGSTENDGDYVWRATGPPSTKCRVRVTSLSDPSYTDKSEEDFTIDYHTTTVLSPNGGEILQIGIPYTIKWHDNFFQDDRVEIVLVRGKVEELIAEISREGQSDFVWTVTGPASSECFIRIIHTRYGIEDSSDTYFSIK